MSAKTCSVDPIATHVVKNRLDLLTPMIGDILRSPLSNGVFPNLLKTLHIYSPQLKKHDLDRELFPSFRQVANIVFLSEVIEKMTTHIMYPSLQSAYRQLY